MSSVWMCFSHFIPWMSVWLRSRSSLYLSQVAHPVGAYPGFLSMKKLEVSLLLPGLGASPLQGYPLYYFIRLPWQFAGTHLGKVFCIVVFHYCIAFLLLCQGNGIKWWGDLQWISWLASYPGESSKSLLVALCYRNWDKLRLDGPCGLIVDFT